MSRWEFLKIKNTIYLCTYSVHQYQSDRFHTGPVTVRSTFGERIVQGEQIGGSKIKHYRVLNRPQTRILMFLIVTLKENETRTRRTLRDTEYCKVIHYYQDVYHVPKEGLSLSQTQREFSLRYFSWEMNFRHLKHTSTGTYPNSYPLQCVVKIPCTKKTLTNLSLLDIGNSPRVFPGSRFFFYEVSLQNIFLKVLFFTDVSPYVFLRSTQNLETSFTP